MDWAACPSPRCGQLDRNHKSRKINTSRAVRRSPVGYADTGASLIVLSSATSGAARLAAKETREIRERLPNTRVLAGAAGDTLSRLRELARASQDPGQ